MSNKNKQKVSENKADKNSEELDDLDLFIERAKIQNEALKKIVDMHESTSKQKNKD